MQEEKYVDFRGREIEQSFCKICGETYLREDLKKLCESKLIEQEVSIPLGTVFFDRVSEHKDFFDSISIPALKKRVKQNGWRFFGILYEGPLIEKQTHTAKYRIIRVEPRVNVSEIGYDHNDPWHLGRSEKVDGNFLLAMGPVDEKTYKEIVDSYENLMEKIRPHIEEIRERGRVEKYTYEGFFGNFLQAAGKSAEIPNLDYICLKLLELELTPYWPLKVRENSHRKNNVLNQF